MHWSKSAAGRVPVAALSRMPGAALGRVHQVSLLRPGRERPRISILAWVLWWVPPVPRFWGPGKALPILWITTFALALAALSHAQTPSAPAPRFVILLDAAHGGDDTGSHLDSGQLEKSVNLALSVRLRSLLAARGFQVITTREADTSVVLDQRAAIANRANAAACLSLHASETGTGVHLFVSSLPAAQPSRFMAWKTAQAAWVTRSLGLAGAVNSALAHAGFNVTLERIPLPGIESMTCPAVAIEVGPQRDSDKKITTEPDNPDYQASVANALAAAVLEWRSDPTRTEAHQP